MYTTYKGKELAIRFTHVNEKNLRATICTVKEKNSEDIFAQAVAKVHPNDNYCKAKGREVSFGKVLQEFVDKKDRLGFWKLYANWKSETPRITLGEKKPKKVKLKVV